MDRFKSALHLLVTAHFAHLDSNVILILPSKLMAAPNAFLTAIFI